MATKATRSRRRYQVVYLTGAPASGKSTLSKALTTQISPLLVFEYGKELTKQLRRRVGGSLRQERLRSLSSKIATSEDIKALDSYLLDKVATTRSRAHVIIDSHAVTKESYGYRITPFRLDQLTILAPDLIVCLYADAPTVRSRIRVDAQGRPPISEFESDFHTFLQSSVAITYSCQKGIPVYFLDSGRPREEMVKWFISKLSASK